MNPLGYVPLLELDDGTKISEGPAIVQYIADKVPAKNLAPANGTPERIKLQSWLNFITSELHKGFSPLFNPAMPDEAKKIFRERLGDALCPSRQAPGQQRLPDGQELLGGGRLPVHGVELGGRAWTSTCRRSPTCWPIASASARGPRCRRP